MAAQNVNSILTNSLLRISATTTTTMLIIIMAIFQAAVNSNESTMWQATVATGNATDAGTNGTIYLIFKGTINSSDVHLWSINGVLFQTGQIDAFTIYTDDIGQLVELTIIHAEFSSSHAYLKWQLDYILLLDQNTSTEYGFHYRNYIPDKGHGFGELTIRPDTIRQLDNKTTVSLSSSMHDVIFSTRNVLVFNASISHSNNPSTFLSDMDTSGFPLATNTIGLIPSLHTAFGGFVSTLTSDSTFMTVATSLDDNSKSFVESSSTNDVPKATSMLFPTSEISFTMDAETLYSTAILPDRATDTFTDISETSIHFTPMSTLQTLRTSAIFSSCSCLTGEDASVGVDFSLRMASVSRELSVDKKQLSVYKRKKSSAPDDRNSAKAIGFVAIFFLALPVVYIILIDLSNYRKFFPEKQRRRIAKQNKRTTVKV